MIGNQVVNEFFGYLQNIEKDFLIIESFEHYMNRYKDNHDELEYIINKDIYRTIHGLLTDRRRLDNASRWDFVGQCWWGVETVNIEIRVRKADGNLPGLCYSNW